MYKRLPTTLANIAFNKIKFTEMNKENVQMKVKIKKCYNKLKTGSEKKHRDNA